MHWDQNGQGWLMEPQENSEFATAGWKKFIEYDEKNPIIWEEFERQTMHAKDRGFTRIGAHFIIQIIRWETAIRAQSDRFKVGNNHFPYYARKFLLKHPECEGLFELRTLKRKNYGMGQYATN